jgi:hypothetical protein
MPLPPTVSSCREGATLDGNWLASPPHTVQRECNMDVMSVVKQKSVTMKRGMGKYCGVRDWGTWQARPGT